MHAHGFLINVFNRISGLSVLILLAIPGLGNEPDSLLSTDTVYYQSLSDKFSLYCYGITKLNSFELRNPQGNNMILYKPNEALNLGLGFNYRWIGIGTAINYVFLNNDNDIFGRTRSFDLQGDIFTKSAVFTANLQTYKGFYWENAYEYDTTWRADSVPLRPDIFTLNVGASGIYIKNNEKFSFKSVYSSTEWQKRSAGSWLYGGQASYYQLDADSNLVPTMLWESYPTYDSLVNLATFSFGFSIGYAYTYVIRQKFYIHAMWMLGIGLQYGHGIDSESNTVFVQGKPSGRTHFRLALGSNNEDFYYGIALITESYPMRNQLQSSFIYRYGRIRFFYGQHLNYTPGKHYKTKNRS